MRTPGRHFLSALLAVLIAAAASPARATLYEFRMGTAFGIGDPALSQAVRGPAGDIYVLVPLQSVTVPSIHTHPTLVFHGPPPGVVLTVPTHQYDVNFGGSLPVCGPTPAPPGAACVAALGTVYVSLVNMTSDVWGHFEGGTDGTPLVWVPNPEPGNRGFNTFLVPPDVPVLFPGSFSMTPLIPEPPIALLLGAGLLALSLRGRSRADTRAGDRP